MRSSFQNQHIEPLRGLRAEIFTAQKHVLPGNHYRQRLALGSVQPA
jgi:hypothetical protein